MDKREIKEANNIGKLCPLCGKGIIMYIRFKGGFFSEVSEIEYITCSNKECSAYIEIE